MSNEFLKNSFVSRPRTTEEIRDLIRCPQLGSEDYGKWGALPLEVRFAIHNLVVSLDNERFCCEKLQQRIDKAIEFINTTECYDDVYGRYMFEDSEVRNEIKELLKILEGYGE